MWGTNAIAGQLAVGEISPMTLVLVRWLMVAVTLTTLFHRELAAAWPQIRPSFGKLALAGFCGLTAFNTLFYIASTLTSGANIGIIQGAMPIMVMAGAYLAYREKVTAVQAVGVVVTIAGVIVLTSKGDYGVLASLSFNYGDLMMFANCAFYAAYAVSLRNRPQIRGVVLFTFFSIVALFTAIPLFLWEVTQADYTPPTQTGWAVAIFIAIVPSFIAQIFFLRAVDLVGPGRAGVYVNLVPVFATFLAATILGEVLSLYHATALVLVLLGIALAQRSKASGG